MSGTSGPPQPQSSSAAAVQDILHWSADLASWQRDALRRLCDQEELSEQDFADLVEFCRGPYDTATYGSAKKPEPLTASHTRADSYGQTVALKSIKDVVNVNALADGQILKFRETGLTVVFGGNGSGKSGYSRVLKKACRARASNAPILPNVYAPPSNKPATATIDYSVSGKLAAAKWVDGAPTDDVLSAISVFDSACAIVHVEKTNDVAYTPAALDLLGRLAETCREVRRRLGSEQRNLQIDVPAGLVTPKCRPETKVGKLLASLSASSNLTDFKQLTMLTDDERNRLETLRANLATDPRKLAEQLRVRKQRLLQSITKVDALRGAADDLAADGLRELVADSVAKSEAARVAAEELFKDEPLPKVGSDTWRALWEAARKYSEAEAYHNQVFPVTGDEARCVLCQQKLQADAALRLSRFEAFVKENAQKSAEDAKRAVQRARSEIQRAKFTGREQTDAIGQVGEELENAAVADELRRFITLARWRRRLLLRAAQPDVWPALPLLPAAPIATLKGLDGDLSQRISELQNAGNSEARRLLEQELQQLEDRLWLSSVLEDVRNDITRRKKLLIVTSAIGDTDTRGITTKSTAVAEKLVTTALRDRFAQELSRLGITRLRVELVQTTSQYGVPKFKVSLIANPSAEVGLVLSEGEHRCIALAAFLSDLATADDQSGIVFDDPVSSLDHDYRQATGKRLVEESLKRQVIIFTHDIVFLTQLAEQARQLGVAVGYQSVGRGEDHSGFCNSEPPMKVRPVLDALDGLETHLINVSYFYKSGDMTKWWREVKNVAGDLRELWERAVEQVLSPVYTRFDYGVDTTGLVKTTILTEQDCRVMRGGYSRCSQLKHSEPRPVGSKSPEPGDLRREIDELRHWLTDILQRQDAVKPV